MWYDTSDWRDAAVDGERAGHRNLKSDDARNAAGAPTDSSRRCSHASFSPRLHGEISGRLSKATRGWRGYQCPADFRPRSARRRPRVSLAGAGGTEPRGTPGPCARSDQDARTALSHPWQGPYTVDIVPLALMAKTMPRAPRSTFTAASHEPTSHSSENKPTRYEHCCQARQCRLACVRAAPENRDKAIAHELECAPP